MGAHGTLEEALSNVASFRSASRAEQGAITKSSSKSSKHKSQKKHKKSKDRTKEKKDSSKKHKKQRRSSSPSSTEEDDIDTPLDLQTQLAKGRESVRITRCILAAYPDMRSDLRQLLGRIDQGAALTVDAIPQRDLRQRLASLFDNLLLNRTRQGVYTKPKHVGSLVLFLQPVFEESPAELATLEHSPSEPDAAEDLPAPLAHSDNCQAPVSDHLASQQPSQQPGQPPSQQPRQQALPSHQQGAGLPQSAADIGPSLAPSDNGQEAAAALASAAASDTAASPPVPALVQGRRGMIGPAAPPQELLDAAAQMAWEPDEEDVEDLIGPPPPELAEELDAVGGDERVSEVMRIIRLLSSASTGKEADAYDVLGVQPTATSGEIKKKYWRLSLLIHPDKCSHPRANDAFQAVSKVSKDLQDASRRKAIDAAREDARLMKIATELADEEERKRQWRVARGEATAEDLSGPARRGPQARDGWMTDLPPERQASSMAPQGNQTSFSQQGIRSRGDTSDWTMTPAQRLLQLQNGSAGQHAIAAGPSWDMNPHKAAATAAAVDRYNSSNRQKSLLEQHQEKKSKKRKSVAGDGPGGNSKDKQGQKDQKDTWQGKHPWRPFDREKDLNIGAKPVSQEDLLKKAGSLTGRFGGPVGQRTFL